MVLNKIIGQYQNGDVSAVDLIKQFKSKTESLCDKIGASPLPAATDNSSMSSMPML